MRAVAYSPRGARNNEQGFTLIEILVSVLILSLGVLGLIAMESLALKNNLSAYHRSQATILAYDLVDKMRANPAGFRSGGYDSLVGVDYGSDCINFSSSATPRGCNAQQIAQQDIYHWLQSVADVLPAGSAALSSGTIQALTLSWDDNRDGSLNNSFALSFEL